MHKRKPVKGALKKDVKEGKGKITGKNGKSGKEEGEEKRRHRKGRERRYRKGIVYFTLFYNLIFVLPASGEKYLNGFSKI